MRGLITVVVTGLLAVQATTNGPPAEDRLALLAPVVGRWTGTTEGEPGSGTVEREYERILGGRFIEVRNRSTYPPQPGNPKGERHEDRGIFSYDTGRKSIVFRQFHVEGFVNQYLLDSASTPERLVFTTEAIENIPEGWRARETYLIEPDRLEEVFELAEPGKAFAVYSRNRLTRIK
jgi:hypothetical protein